jgi:hypothetical protein
MDTSQGDQSRKEWPFESDFDDTGINLCKPPTYRSKGDAAPSFSARNRGAMMILWWSLKTGQLIRSKSARRKELNMSRKKRKQHSADSKAKVAWLLN